MSPVRTTVAGVQLRSEPFAVERNLVNAARYVRDAASNGAKIILLPELFNTGYAIDRRLFDVWEPLDGRTVTWLRELATETGAMVAGSIAERRGDRLLNTLCAVEPGGALHTYSKRQPTRGESAAFDAGADENLFETALGPVGAIICADIHWPHELLRPLAGRASVLLYPQASNAPRWLAGWIDRRGAKAGRPMLLGPLAALGCPAVSAGLVGPVQRLTRLVPSYLLGGTWVLDAGGHALAHVPFEEEGVATATVDLGPGAGDPARLKSEGWSLMGLVSDALVIEQANLRPVRRR